MVTNHREQKSVAGLVLYVVARKGYRGESLSAAVFLIAAELTNDRRAAL